MMAFGRALSCRRCDKNIPAGGRATGGGERWVATDALGCHVGDAVSIVLFDNNLACSATNETDVDTGGELPAINLDTRRGEVLGIGAVKGDIVDTRA